MESSILDKRVVKQNTLLRELQLAARSGVEGNNCWKLYPHCPQLDKIVAQTANANATTTSEILFKALTL